MSKLTVAVLYFTLAWPLSILWEGFVFSMLWDWFVVPTTGLEPISFGMACGVTVLLGAIQIKVRYSDFVNELNSAETHYTSFLVDSVVTSSVSWALVLLSGATINHFCT